LVQRASPRSSGYARLDLGSFASKHTKMAAELFKGLGDMLKGEPSVVEKTKAIFVYKLSKAGKTTSWTLDLKNAPGAIYQGEVKNGGKADVEFTMSEDDFIALINKKANPQQLFMGGKMKLKGNMALAMKFEGVLKGLEAAGKGPKSKL